MHFKNDDEWTEIADATIINIIATIQEKLKNKIKIKEIRSNDTYNFIIISGKREYLDDFFNIFCMTLAEDIENINYSKFIL